MLKGTTLFGFLDDWSGLVEDVNESYDFKAVVESEAGKTVGVTMDVISAVRTQAAVSCNVSTDDQNLEDEEDDTDLTEGSDGDTLENETSRKKRESFIMRNYVFSRHQGLIPCDPLIEPCLFNIVLDPCETKNLAHLYPEKVHNYTY